MPFFIVLGLILIGISVCVRFTGKWTMENSQCPENDKKEIKGNKINFYIFLILGIVFMVGGIIGLIII